MKILGYFRKLMQIYLLCLSLVSIYDHESGLSYLSDPLYAPIYYKNYINSWMSID